MSKGPNFTTVEDLELCKAFIAASDDATVGTDQKSAEFKLKMFENYCKLIDEHNEAFDTSYLYRQGHSNFLRFKRISKYALKWIGIEESAGDPPSGDTEKIEWLKQIKETFLQRHPDGKNILENVLFCKEFLQESPKWRSFEESQDKVQRKKRPSGSKKSKQVKADMEIIQRITGNSEKQKKKEASIQKHQKAQRDFMQSATNGMSAIAAVLSEQNDTKLLEMMTPTTRNEMAKQMFKLKMKKLMSQVGVQQEHDAMQLPSSPDEQDRRAEVSPSTNRKTNNKRKNRVQERNEYAEEEEEEEEEEEPQQEDDSTENGDDNSSPGDNRVRSPGGTLRLPAHIARRYEQQANKRTSLCRRNLDLSASSDDES
jgi:hypothetical protein